jgi:hypothetical protein
MIFDLSQGKLTSTYDQPTRMYNVNLMGAEGNRLFVNLSRDGILVVDTTNPAAPRGISFLRTLGWASHLEFFGDDVYVASGYFGLSHLGLGDLPSLPPQE